MKSFRLILMVATIVMATISANAQVFTNACYVASTGRIWEATGGCGYYVMVCDGSDIEYATITLNTGINCTPCNGIGTGKRVTINVLPCPIDDYEWILILASGLGGFLLIKGKNKRLTFCDFA